jgi:hypothetical protein
MTQLSENNPTPPDSQVLYELMGGMYIQMLRIYDVLCLLAQDNPRINELIELHESGRVLSPEPALIMEEEKDETSI